MKTYKEITEACERGIIRVLNDAAKNSNRYESTIQNNWAFGFYLAWAEITRDMNVDGYGKDDRRLLDLAARKTPVPEKETA